MKKKYSIIIVVAALSMSFATSAETRGNSYNYYSDYETRYDTDKSDNYPNISGRIQSAVYATQVIASALEDKPSREIAALANPALSFNFDENLSIRTSWNFEPTQPRKAGQVRYFGKEGLYMEEATVRFSNSDLYAYTGKFTAPFGKAWYSTSGIYGNEIADEYAITEKIGFGGAALFTDSVKMEFATFFADNTTFRNSTITARDDIRGKPSDNGQLSSFSIAIGDSNSNLSHGTNYLTKNFSYGIAYSSLAGGFVDAKRQKSLLVNASAIFLATDGIEVKPMCELVRVVAKDGIAGNSFYYMTNNLEIAGHSWSLSGAYSVRRTISLHSNRLPTNDRGRSIMQISLSYKMDDNTKLTASRKLEGYYNDLGRHATEAAYGMLLSYNFGIGRI